jgi:hypothetical protein
MTDTNLEAYFDPDLKKTLVLRRYMDLPKFVDFIQRKELYLGQASRFDDYLEGTLPEKIRQIVRKLPDFLECYSDPTTWESNNRDRTYLSCWTHEKNDNMALWKIYGRSNESVAITTTVERLIEIAPAWSKYGRVDIKKVKYINPSKRLPNGVYAFDQSVFGLKHKAYAFEKEVRIVITSPDDNLISLPRAIRVPVKIDSFLKDIIVAPEAGDWFLDIIKYVTGKYEVRTPVHRSALTKLISMTNRFKKPE